MNLERKELFRAIEKCLLNAQELYDEAVILEEHKRYARAYTLFQICIEEVGKTSLIHKFLFDNNVETSTINKFLKDFRDHKVKIKSSISYDKIFSVLIEKIEIDEKDLKASLDKEILNQYENVSRNNDYKNFSLYTSFYKDDFRIPSELFFSEHVDSIKFVSTMRLNMAKNFYEVNKAKIDEF
ncbi:AbiV family abortive infection protein [Flavobacterium sp. 102]|uniref:AbiV family abortive infection protein n=1 Tax=Flavobacterium sp. 102 TaxID=2135623 RepID=UPI000EAC995C|nr:AbiV family abortive infection protein [Flavobacterium sp. 102]RKS01459.1 AbiV family abortive infection protein [Flavobacterium sp. 102]